MFDSVAIVSGGMDSITLLHFLVKKLKKTPLVLSFAYGQRHNKELGFVKENVGLLGCGEYLVFDLSNSAEAFAKSALTSQENQIPDARNLRPTEQPATYVPNRNMVFLSLAVALAETTGAGEVYFGAQAHDIYGYWDTSPEFVERFNQILALNRESSVKVFAPFVDYKKSDVLKTGMELGVDYKKTWSCYQGGKKACGTCPTCMERLRAFADLGVEDPIKYRKRLVA